MELLRPCFVSQWAGIAPPMFHFAMGWNRSAHVSFRNGLESLRPCFVLLVLDGAFVYLFNVVFVARLDLFHLQSCWCSTGVPSSFNFAVVWIFRAICISLWLGFSALFVRSTGLLFICLMSCWWLDSMFFIFSPVGARRDFCSFV